MKKQNSIHTATAAAVLAALLVILSFDAVAQTTWTTSGSPTPSMSATSEPMHTTHEHKPDYGWIGLPGLLGLTGLLGRTKHRNDVVHTTRTDVRP